MSRLFWKLFLTMWLSIVGFSAAIGWVNDKLAREQWAEEPANTFSRGMYRIAQRMKVTLATGGSEAAREELIAIPRMSRNYIFVTDDNDREILQRDAILRGLRDRHGGIEIEQVESDGGGNYTIYLVDRIATNHHPGTRT